VEARQIAGLQAVRRRRDQALVDRLMDRLEREAREPATNIMPVTIELVKARATLGEIVARLRTVWGAYIERPVF
jgi:methylmalonyl-CoA mutase N-terminal domain/subunit